VTGYPLGDTLAGGLARTVVYDAASRTRAMTHTGDGSGLQSPTLFDQRFEYDDLNRLTQFTVNNFSQTYLYDANGNRTQVQQGAAGYANDIALTSNRLQRAAAPEGTRNFTYDAEGNIKTDGTLSFAFALHGRMRSVNSPAGKTTYWYNALGQRVRKTGQDTTYYFYDGEGRVLGEYDSNGSAIQETVYLDNMPVVVLKQEQGNTVPYYIYADHINTPRVITRASDNAMVWRWDNADPFGAAAPDTSLAGTFAYNPRFPGQLFDAESGLHQNYFRDYDPRAGRYVTSDPIGLGGGMNTYAYVVGNPLSMYDPYGLFGVADLPTLPQGVVDFSAGVGDTLSFNITDWIRDQADFNAVNKCSGAYVAGEWTGLSIAAATGVAGGIRAAGSRGAGSEFSHWIPKRMGGPRSIWNGNFVSTATHALSDPYRYRFMPRVWKEANPPMGTTMAQWTRLPNAYKGAAGGGAYGGASKINSENCKCQR
jgi:RHS repeat-associated protein